MEKTIDDFKQAKLTTEDAINKLLGFFVKEFELSDIDVKIETTKILTEDGVTKVTIKSEVIAKI